MESLCGRSDVWDGLPNWWTNKKSSPLGSLLGLAKAFRMEFLPSGETGKSLFSTSSGSLLHVCAGADGLTLSFGFVCVIGCHPWDLHGVVTLVAIA